MTTYISKWTVGALGFITLAVLFMSWFLAMICDPSWTLGVDTLADLGSSYVDSARFLINIGFFVFGGFLVAIVGGLYLFTKKSRLLHVIYAILIVFSGIAMIVTGCNPYQDAPEVHDYASLTAVILIGALYVLTTAEAWIDKRYFGAAMLTSGAMLLAILSTPMSLPIIQPVIVVYFMLLLLYFSTMWCKKKVETVVSLYGNEVKA